MNDFKKLGLIAKVELKQVYVGEKTCGLPQGKGVKIFKLPKIKRLIK